MALRGFLEMSHHAAGGRATNPPKTCQELFNDFQVDLGFGEVLDGVYQTMQSWITDIVHRQGRQVVLTRIPGTCLSSVTHGGCCRGKCCASCCSRCQATSIDNVLQDSGNNNAHLTSE
jgi:hypothetical protein